MRRLALAALVVLSTVLPARAYSVLAHEALVDSAWDGSIRPLLMRRFPRTTPDALMEARSYAYGGSVIQDLGYYPFGNKFFSNLLHYTRSGDFIARMIRDAHDPNELAFALGALAHFVGDTTGHREAVNPSVPILFPKLGARFGNEVTYVEAPKQHIITEFSFDVVQTAAGTYEPAAYRRFIGFRVAKPLLERAFLETYGLELKDVFPSEDRAISTYRYAVSQIMPALTKAAWRDKRKEIATLIPNVQQNAFVFQYGRIDFERQYGKDYDKPALFARFLAVVYRIVPKFGPLKKLSFKAPTPEAQEKFIQSFEDARTRYRSALEKVAAGNIDIRNADFDTGNPARHGEYALADETYAELLEKLTKRSFAGVTPALRRDVLAFYGQNPSPSSSKEVRKHWDEVSTQLTALRNQH
ncbi:MAG TPA: zinc dependent phospholipase C family protein [Vicinamibacterales bacterium]